MTAVTDEDRAAYLALLVEADTAAALGFAGGLLDRGVAPEGVLLDLIARSQARVGELWAGNERRVPLVTVDMTLQWYAEVFYDFPRALAHLSAGRRVLSAG